MPKVNQVTGQATISLWSLECANCGMTFAVPDKYDDDRREDHRNFHCPSGHPNHYPQQSETERLKLALTNERRQREYAEGQREHHRRSAAALKGHATRLRKRAAAGVCPCCTRTFKQLARHMKNKHPEYGGE